MTRRGEAVRTRIMEFVRAEIDQTERFPSLDRITDELDISSKSVTWSHVQVLVRRGDLVRVPWFGNRNTYRLTGTSDERRVIALARELADGVSARRKEAIIDEMRDIFDESDRALR